jgi:hypothetical protein
MLFLMWPAAGLLLVPIVLAEAWCARRLIGAGWKQSLVVATQANVISTLVGMPLAWVVMLILEFLALAPLSYWAPNVDTIWTDLLVMTLGAAWVSPSADWQVPFAAAVLCVPFYLVSRRRRRLGAGARISSRTA